MSEFERLFELRDISVRLGSPNAYFQLDDTKFADPLKRSWFVDIARELQGLDAEAWSCIKDEAVSRLTAKVEGRGWTPLFEVLNEAKAFNYLTRRGCTEVKFIPRSKLRRVRTPDLRAMLNSRKVLCEVKTINASAREIDRRMSGGVGATLTHLEDGFFAKLTSDSSTATSQMLVYDGDPNVLRIAYLVINFDDNLHEYAIQYRQQIEAHINGVVRPTIEVELDIKPPFYSAGLRNSADTAVV